ncbi:SHNi-TPR domain-containing protein Ecym_6206 [Eremothecium cymbalariae DBVPG|uniref:Tetratricopeptide SHNi-TPR domain-containing protein n=1 Tax=Eremothecium cymbalariae (strain CBS 270.75 / DBVPG 7215 / KCTC 17166 / NRRL Y-17582) TaxID=931890 RepID=G8JVB0_ERECY|nr:hypothetical protein Ecym_6206 [Eremothecium cymbalariae DBVPG\
MPKNKNKTCGEFCTGFLCTCQCRRVGICLRVLCSGVLFCGAHKNKSAGCPRGLEHSRRCGVWAVVLRSPHAGARLRVAAYGGGVTAGRPAPGPIQDLIYNYLCCAPFWTGSGRKKLYTMSLQKDASGLLQQAAKAYAAKDYETAVNLYSEVNELYEAAHGEPNADYLFLYGRSLYQNALAQSDVLGGLGDAEEDAPDAEERPAQGKGKGKQLFQFGAEVADEEESDTGPPSGPVSPAGPADGTPDTPPVHEDSDSGDGGDLEAAWEVLDLARSIYEKNIANDGSRLDKLAETYDILGEVSLESENFEQAAEDFKSCLELREKLYQEKDGCHRLLIESHYKISLALEFDRGQNAACQEHLSKCIELLSKRIAAGNAERDDEELLLELQSRRRDVEEAAAEGGGGGGAASAQHEMVEQLLAVAAAGGKVNDLTAMVKRKATRDSESREKKPKI